MHLIDAVWLGILQGLTELFPFSSLGILVILPHLVHVSIPSGSAYLPFLVALHVGTALALVWYFRRDWVDLAVNWWRWWGGHRSTSGRLAWLIIWATIPAGLVGLVLKNRIANLFGNPDLAAFFLLVNAGVMLMGDRMARRAPATTELNQLSLGQAVKIGVYQIFALIPGLSRSGLTITGGVSSRMGFEDAAHFSFLLATPIILAAGLAELPKLHHGGIHGMLVPAVVGGILAGVTAWFSTRYLLRYFQNHDLGRLALISAILGAVSLIGLWLGV